MRKKSLMQDLGIIVLSVVLAIVLVKTGAFRSVLTSTEGSGIIGSFVAGIFFVSIFTAAPATAVFAEIAQANSIWLVAFFGGLGALLGDLIIFHFIRNRLSADVSYVLKRSKLGRFAAIFQLRLFRWLVPLLGAIVVASPLPDELGLMMLGLSRTKTRGVIPLSFTLNFIGILVIGAIAQAV